MCGKLQSNDHGSQHVSFHNSEYVNSTARQDISQYTSLHANHHMNQHVDDHVSQTPINRASLPLTTLLPVAVRRTAQALRLVVVYLGTNQVSGFVTPGASEAGDWVLQRAHLVVLENPP